MVDYPRRFTLSELTHTDTGLPNLPDWERLENVRQTGLKLDSIRDAFRRPIRVNCCYRSEAVNERVGGVSNSAHTKGLAADICAYDGTETGNRRLYSICRESILSLSIDQLILYTDKPGVESSRIRFVHVGFRAFGQTPRGQILFK